MAGLDKECFIQGSHGKAQRERALACLIAVLMLALPGDPIPKKIQKVRRHFFPFPFLLEAAGLGVGSPFFCSSAPGFSLFLGLLPDLLGLPASSRSSKNCLDFLGQCIKRCLRHLRLAPDLVLFSRCLGAPYVGSVNHVPELLTRGSPRSSSRLLSSTT